MKDIVDLTPTFIKVEASLTNLFLQLLCIPTNIIYSYC